MRERERARYKVVVDEHGNHMVWPIGLANQAGWRDGGPAGSIEDCLAFIAAVWSDALLRAQHE
jgi:MbtH protein